MLADSDHPFSDLRVDPQDWLGPTVVAGEGQTLQGRLGIYQTPGHIKADMEIQCPEMFEEPFQPL